MSEKEQDCETCEYHNDGYCSILGGYLPLDETGADCTDYEEKK